jgi:hypothetical protein
MSDHGEFLGNPGNSMFEQKLVPTHRRLGYYFHLADVELKHTTLGFHRSPWRPFPTINDFPTWAVVLMIGLFSRVSVFIGL